MMTKKESNKTKNTNAPIGKNGFSSIPDPQIKIEIGDANAMPQEIITRSTKGRSDDPVNSFYCAWLWAKLLNPESSSSEPKARIGIRMGTWPFRITKKSPCFSTTPDTSSQLISSFNSPFRI